MPLSVMSYEENGVYYTNNIHHYTNNYSFVKYFLYILFCISHLLLIVFYQLDIGRLISVKLNDGIEFT